MSDVQSSGWLFAAVTLASALLAGLALGRTLTSTSTVSSVQGGRSGAGAMNPMAAAASPSPWVTDVAGPRTAYPPFSVAPAVPAGRAVASPAVVASSLPLAADVPGAIVPTTVTITGACPPLAAPIRMSHTSRRLQQPSLGMANRASTGAGIAGAPVRSASNARAAAGSRSLDELIRKAAATN